MRLIICVWQSIVLIIDEALPDLHYGAMQKNEESYGAGSGVESE